MTPPSPGAAELLEALAQCTAELTRAAQAGDLAAADRALSDRELRVTSLQAALQPAALSREQLETLEDAIRQGDNAVRLLRTRRETARAQIGELDALRRRLEAWMPKRAASGGGLDLRG